jgi:hypothetical protein
MAAFSVPVLDQVAIVAGSSGLRLLRIDASSSGTVSDLELWVYPAAVLTGGSVSTPSLLTGGGPAALSTAYQGSFSISGTAPQIIDRWRLQAVDRASFELAADLTILAGSALWIVATSASVSMRITPFFEE